MKGRHDARLSQSELALLSFALREVKLENMRNHYFIEEDGCGPLPTDYSSLSISVQQGGKTKSVGLYAGCHGPDVPSDALHWLAGTIDFVGKTGKLIQ